MDENICISFFLVKNKIKVLNVFNASIALNVCNNYFKKVPI